ncbi:uncharacterized protein LOC119665815 [Teleopsis dalmanni]|uniref:uncharacterized protein LOC119665814 n=1 Tax=Teleopsis dalmanni TaxID=139649 RepID=UPI0018CCBD7B|nr:uncharacterized protein LOC119665814 [Teleopsis dalmanni]XP_037930992.1 uncharacterized protein LOC119665815 [Teleopsis dalmanni]
METTTRQAQTIQETQSISQSWQQLLRTHTQEVLVKDTIQQEQISQLHLEKVGSPRLIRKEPSSSGNRKQVKDRKSSTELPSQETPGQRNIELNTELQSQETQRQQNSEPDRQLRIRSQECRAQVSINRVRQQEQLPPQEKFNVDQPKAKGTKSPTLVRQCYVETEIPNSNQNRQQQLRPLVILKQKDDNHNIKDQDDFYKIYKSPKKRKRNRASV